MNSDSIRDEIERLEARIEQLDDSIERCRKLSLAAKLAITSGVGWIALTLTLIVTYVPALTFAALAVAIGGVVLLGSNSTTWTQMQAAREAAETQRTSLISGLELRAVDAGVRRLH